MLFLQPNCSTSVSPALAAPLSCPAAPPQAGSGWPTQEVLVAVWADPRTGRDCQRVGFPPPTPCSPCCSLDKLLFFIAGPLCQHAGPQRMCHASAALPGTSAGALRARKRICGSDSCRASYWLATSSMELSMLSSTAPGSPRLLGDYGQLPGILWAGCGCYRMHPGGRLLSWGCPWASFWALACSHGLPSL